MIFWGGKERRRFVRVTFPCKITTATHANERINARTENVSAGGVRVLLDEEIPVSAVVTIQLYLTQDPIHCTGKIIWAIKKEMSGAAQGFVFDTGIYFDHIQESDVKVINDFVAAVLEGEDRRKKAGGGDT